MGSANGHSRSSKRDRSAELDTDHANYGNKRSRLGNTASVQQVEAARSHPSNDCQQPHEQGWVEGNAPLPIESEADAAYHGVMQMVHQVHNNQLSQHACEVKSQIRNLDAAEGIGVMAWLIDGMLTQHTDPEAHALITDWVTDLADFAKHRIQLSRT